LLAQTFTFFNYIFVLEPCSFTFKEEEIQERI
jgi:hypothetical protein